VRRARHAGDVGAPEVLAALAAIAPVTAVRGNNDRGRWARRLPVTATIAVGGARLHVLHDRHQLRFDPHARGIDVVISGHSHRPLIERRGGVLFVNPGSAGPRRFRLPVAVARLRITAGTVGARVLALRV
jgi:putative phosphoesterase